MKAKKLFKKLRKACKGEGQDIPTPKETASIVFEFATEIFTIYRIDFFIQFLNENNFPEKKNPVKGSRKCLDKCIALCYIPSRDMILSCDFAYALLQSLQFCYSSKEYDEFLKELNLYYKF